MFLQTVAITEKKQYCGGEEKLTTTKICFTYPDASWVCKVSSFFPSLLAMRSVTKEPRESYDCLDDGVKLVAHEVKFYFSGQIQRTSGQTNTYLKLEIC